MLLLRRRRGSASRSCTGRARRHGRTKGSSVCPKDVLPVCKEVAPEICLCFGFLWTRAPRTLVQRIRLDRGSHSAGTRCPGEKKG